MTTRRTSVSRVYVVLPRSDSVLRHKFKLSAPAAAAPQITVTARERPSYLVRVIKQRCKSRAVPARSARKRLQPLKRAPPRTVAGAAAAARLDQMPAAGHAIPPCPGPARPCPRTPPQPLSVTVREPIVSRRPRGLRVTVACHAPRRPLVSRRGHRDARRRDQGP